jgi:hypothetical protein
MDEASRRNMYRTINAKTSMKKTFTDIGLESHELKLLNFDFIKNSLLQNIIAIFYQISAHISIYFADKYPPNQIKYDSEDIN